MYRKSSLLTLLGVGAVLVSSASAIIFVEETINVGNEPRSIIYDSINQKVFVANYGSGSVSVINPATLTVVATVAVDEYPSAMCWSPTSSKIYVVSTPQAGNGSVTVIDAYTNTVLTSFGVGVNPKAIVWNSTLNKAYCLNGSQTGSVSAIDCASDQVVATMSFATEFTGSGIAYNPINDHVYASNNKPASVGKVTAINCATDQIVATITTQQNNTVTVEVNPVSNKVYAANSVSNSVTVINCATNQRIGNIPTRRGPTPLRWVPPNKLWVGEYWDSTIAYLGGNDLSIPSQNHIKVAGPPKTLLAIPDCQQIFSALDLASKVVALDARDGQEKVLEVLSVGSGPQGMVYFQPMNRVFVANAWDTTVTVIRTEIGIEESGGPVPPSGPALARALPCPAPARHMVNFSATGFAPTRLDVRDTGGRLVYSAVGKAARAWQAPAAGVYFCTLSDGVRSAACKLAVR
jgi:YVTN family beta-propeller protein